MKKIEYVKTQLNFLFERTNQLYQLYQKEPIYIRALPLKNVNQKIIDLLLDHGFIFPLDQQKDINEIINHFEIWLFQFNELKKTITTPSDPFIFQRLPQATPYPKLYIKKILYFEDHK